MIKSISLVNTSIKNNLKIMDDDQIDPIEDVEEEEELDENGLPKDIPDDVEEEEEEVM